MKQFISGGGSLLGLLGSLPRASLPAPSVPHLPQKQRHLGYVQLPPLMAEQMGPGGGCDWLIGCPPTPLIPCPSPPPPLQRVHLDIQVGEHTNNYPEIAAKDKLTELQLRARQLLDQVEQIQKEQNYQRVRAEGPE